MTYYLYVCDSIYVKITKIEYLKLKDNCRHAGRFLRIDNLRNNATYLSVE